MKITRESRGFPVSELTNLGGDPDLPEGTTPDPDCCEATEDTPPIDRANDTGSAFIYDPAVSGDGSLVQDAAAQGSGSSVVVVMAGDVTDGNTLIVLITERATTEPDEGNLPTLGYVRINDPFTSSPGHNGGASSLWYKIADGSEGDTLSLSFGSAEGRRAAWAEFAGTLTLDESAWTSDESNGTTESVGPVTPAAGALLVVGWDTSKQTPPYTVTLNDSFTELDNGVVNGAAGQPTHALGYKVIAAGSYSSSITTSSSTNGRGGVLASFLVTPPDDSASWVPGGDDAIDDDDATYVALTAGTNLLRIDLGGQFPITSTRLVLSSLTAGSKTLTIKAANEADFSDEVTIATVPFTSAGAYAAATLTASWSAADYQYWQLTGTSDTYRVYTWELLEAASSATSLDGLSDVSTSSATDGDVLTFNGSSWVPRYNVARITANGSNTVQGPFVNFASGSNITFAVSSNTLTITGQAGGSVSGDTRWLNVEDYGAVHDGSTDDTTAIQDAIDAARDNALAGSGPTEVFFPPGIYIVGGALQDTGRSKAQILLPRISTASSEQIAIRLFGQTPPPPIVSVGATTVTTPTHHTIIKSTLSSGTGALMGAWGPSGSWQNGSAVQVQIENIAFRMPANPTNSCLDFSHVMGIELVNVLVDTGEYNLPSITQPTHTGSFGVRTPNNVVSSGFSWLRTVNVVGFWCAYDVSELANLDMVHAWGSIYGFNFNESNHGILCKRIGAFGVQRGITSPDGAGSVYVDILAFETEHETNGPNPSWMLTVYDIDDPLNAMYGQVRYHNQTYGSSPGGMPLVNGGAGLSITVGFERWHRTIGPVEMPNAPSTPSTPSLTGGVFYSASKKPTWKDSDGNVFDLTGAGTPATTVEAETTFGISSAVGSDTEYARQDHTHGTPALGTTSTTAAAGDHTHASSGGVGEILITDSPSTPLIFGDLLQNEAQDDLLYADT